MKKTSFGLSALLATGVLGVGAGMGVASMSSAHASGSQPQSITVFVDATFGFRKDHMARKLSKSHAEYAADGYHFADMNPYVENGDLEGFFVTYTRD
ncbi:MAG: hypothetical protein WCD66_07655 [Rhodanobacteraceae bacterium]